MVVNGLIMVSQDHERDFLKSISYKIFNITLLNLEKSYKTCNELGHKLKQHYSFFKKILKCHLF